MRMRVLRSCGIVAAGLCAAALLGLWLYAGPYGLNVLFRHGGTWWVTVGTDSNWLSSAMRLALSDAPVAEPGGFAWRTIETGFDVADLDARVNGQVVDRVRLVRIDPALFRFEIKTAFRGDTKLDDWMTSSHPVMVVNGSYSDRHGRAATPLISDGALQGPSDYDAKAGAFIGRKGSVGVLDLRDTDYHAAFAGASDAMVSFPLLIADGQTHVEHPSRWLANRSFVGQDRSGHIVIGTTDDAFFTLDRFARFLLEAPLDLTTALNLDGGPVASQAVSLNGFDRQIHGRWEAQVQGDQVKLLVWPYGSVAMPIALMAYRKDVPP